MPTNSAILAIFLSIALLIGGVWIGQNINLLPIDASINAPVYDELFRVLLTIGAILFIGMIGLVIYSLIRFRRRPGETGDGIALEGNLPLEIFWTAVPAVVILFVGIYSYDIYERMGGMQSLSMSSHGEHSMTSEERIWGGIGSTTSQAQISEQKLPIVDIELCMNIILYRHRLSSSKI